MVDNFALDWVMIKLEVGKGRSIIKNVETINKQIAKAEKNPTEQR